MPGEPLPQRMVFDSDHRSRPYYLERTKRGSGLNAEALGMSDIIG
jgi:hypothetical protein